ncbi:MAG: hypothetical protein LBP76_13705 [Treponema sp.]|jgi:hypothetical protein|nr:hypothetical protein [Treponema sp.]
MVYLAKKNGEVIHHTDMAAMMAIDGIETPDLAIPDSAFAAYGYLARVIDGEIYLGKTEAEKAEDKKLWQIAQIDEELVKINEKSIRASAALSLATAKGETPNEEDIQFLQEYEARAEELRDERRLLTE